MFAGSATVFFAFIGFDSVASTAEEVNFGIHALASLCSLEALYWFLLSTFSSFKHLEVLKMILTSIQVRNPQRDLPIGIGLALLLCCSLYMMVSIVIVGLIPYYAMDPDTPISSAFASHDMQWAV